MWVMRLLFRKVRELYIFKNLVMSLFNLMGGMFGLFFMIKKDEFLCLESVFIMGY